MIELGTEAGRALDRRATERLIGLETADVDVPPPPSTATRPPLYFRILSTPSGTLRVELWELGRPEGARSVSLAGSESLRARRIALAAAELARQLRTRRLAELAAARRGAASPRASGEAGTPLHARFTWTAGGKGALLGGTAGWLAGPAMDLTLRFSEGPRVAVGAAWLAGGAGRPSDGLRWLEGTWSVSQGFAVSSSTDVTVGLVAAAASVRVAPPSGPPVDTWSARAAAALRVEPRVAPHVALSVGPDVGVVLRPVGEAGAPGSRARGLFLGLSIGGVLDPSGR